MALTLLVLSGNRSDQVPLTLDGPRIVVGRAENADVRLPDYSVSLRHASFRQRGGDYLIVDEGSTNGTFVGPVRLSPQAPRVIRSGDQIRFGRIWVEAQLESVPATAQAKQAARELALQLVAQALTRSNESTSAQLVVHAGPDSGAQLTLECPEYRYVLGRATNSDLVLRENNASRRHVEVLIRSSQVYARDLGSKNGTLLASLPLPSRLETAWPVGAKMQIGRDEIRLVDPVTEALLELESGADEVISPDEEVPIPRQQQGEVEGGSQTTQTAVATDPPVPVRRPKSLDLPGLLTGDILVGLLALAVLAASLFGLYWLLGDH